MWQGMCVSARLWLARLLSVLIGAYSGFPTRTHHSIHLHAVAPKCPACSLSQAQIDELEMGAFFSAMKRVDTSRDYTIIVDASGSMWSPGSVAGKTRWDEARAAVAFLAPHVVQCDPDGLSLYFFGSSFKKYDNVTSADRVNQLFSQTSSLGCTDLAAVLADAVAPDYAGRPETSYGACVCV